MNINQANKTKQENAPAGQNFVRRRLWRLRIYLKKTYTEIEIEIPIGWKNCAVTLDNKFVADTNNSKTWDTLSFPLPLSKYGWKIKCYSRKIGTGVIKDKVSVVLIDKP